MQSKQLAFVIKCMYLTIEPLSILWTCLCLFAIGLDVFGMVRRFLTESVYMAQTPLSSDICAQIHAYTRIHWSYDKWPLQRGPSTITQSYACSMFLCVYLCILIDFYNYCISCHGAVWITGNRHNDGSMIYYYLGKVNMFQNTQSIAAEQQNLSKLAGFIHMLSIHP